MSALPAILEGVDPRLLEQSKNILRALNPTLTPARLNKIAEVMARQTKSISESASSLEELRARNQEMKRLCNETLPPNEQEQLHSTLLDFGKEQKNILKVRHLTLEQPVEGDREEELDQEISEATARSINKAKDLQQQTCQMCHTPNRCITDSPDPQHLLKKCTRCKKVMYCSRECQSKDWPRHKKVECLQ